MASGRRAVSMADVVDQAGVSAMTVSRVLNNKGGVATPTHDRVLAAVAVLDYRPNQNARSLRTGTTDRICVVVRPHPNLDTRLFSAFDLTAQAHHRVMELFIGSSAPRGSGNLSGDTVLRGAIVVDVDLEEAATTIWRSSGEPAVLVTAETPVAAAVPTVSTRDDEGARRAVAHLVGQGHDRIAHVAGPRGSGRSVARQRGWLEALQEAGSGRGRLVRGDWTSESGERAAADLFDRAEQPTAVFVADDAMAIGVLKHLHRRGVAVPGEVSVMGFGDLPGVQSLIPGLSTVRLDYPGVATATFAHLEQGGGAATVPAVPQLVLRESTGLPPHA